MEQGHDIPFTCHLCEFSELSELNESTRDAIHDKESMDNTPAGRLNDSITVESELDETTRSEPGDHPVNDSINIDMSINRPEEIQEDSYTSHLWMRLYCQSSPSPTTSC